MRRTIETGDMYRGAYLLCAGGYLEDARMTGRGEVRFLISGEEIQDEDLRYGSGQALVNPVQLRETLNLLRDVLFEQRRRHGSATG